MSTRQHNEPVLRGTFVAIVTLAGNAFFTLPSLAQSQFPSVPQLSGDFTLKYSAIRTANQTSGAKDAIFQANASGIDAAVKDGRLTQAEATKEKLEIEQDLKHDSPPDAFYIVLSMRQGKLLYRMSGTMPSVFIWDGKNSYAYDVKEAGLQVKTGFGFRQVAELPLPGVGLSEIPLIKLPTVDESNMQIRGDVYTNDVQPNGPFYMSGILQFAKEQDGTVRLTGGEWRDNGEIKGRSEYSGTAAIGNVLIARQIQLILYNHLIRHALGTAPEVDHTIKYTLVSFSNQALAEDQFKPTFYFPAPDSSHPEVSGPVVYWSAPGHQISFRHDPSKTLEQQYNEHLQIQKSDADLQHTRENKRNGIAGPILMVLLLVGATWWLVRRKGSSTR